ncbi:hypothetical protein B0H14DRAFT_2579818 [Mycena olivaceomarginata]|nr:hypothetical protein B0H14DRAFT_2579818 [Mycena olivaceomarginata]
MSSRHVEMRKMFKPVALSEASIRKMLEFRARKRQLINGGHSRKARKRNGNKLRQSDSASSVQMMQMRQCGVSPLWKGIELHPSTPEALGSSAVAYSTGVSEVGRIPSRMESPQYSMAVLWGIHPECSEVLLPSTSSYSVGVPPSTHNKCGKGLE